MDTGISSAPSSGIIWGGDASVLQINFGAPQTSSSYSAVIKMQATGPCGLYTQNFSVTNILTQQPSSDFSVYPNPASQSGTLEISRNKIDFERLIYAIKIIDRFGVQRRMVEFKNGISSVKIPLGDLNPSLYTLSVFDGKNWNSKQLLIQK